MPYHAPTDLQSALDLVARSGGRIVAGGTDLYPAMQQGHAPECLIDVTRIDGLSEIAVSAHGVRIGGAVTWSEIVQADLPAAFDGLKEAAREVGSLQIQNAGTIAGNLCNASPAADGVPPLLALDAQVELSSLERGMRTIPLQEFLRGVRDTALAADEIVTAIAIPPLPEGATSAFEKLGSRKYLVISITMTAAVITCDAEGRIMDARVAVGACSPVAQRLPELEADMLGLKPADIVVEPSHLKALSPIEDVRGGAKFRLDVVREQCLRAVRRAAADE